MVKEEGDKKAGVCLYYFFLPWLALNGWVGSGRLIVFFCYEY